LNPPAYADDILLSAEDDPEGWKVKEEGICIECYAAVGSEVHDGVQWVDQPGSYVYMGSGVWE
jgi:hypothetical protein